MQWAQWTKLSAEDAARSLPLEAGTRQIKRMDFEPTDTVIRAARELLRWDQDMLAARAKVGIATLRRFEGGGDISDEKIEAIVAALQSAGVAFLGPKTRRVDVKSGVALTDAAIPEQRPPKRVYSARLPRGTGKSSKPAA